MLCAAGRMILRVDMDALYASIEQPDTPWLKGKCVVGGGASDRTPAVRLGLFDCKAQTDSN